MSRIRFDNTDAIFSGRIARHASIRRKFAADRRLEKYSGNLNQLVPQTGNRHLMVGVEEVGLSAVGNSARGDRLPGAVVIERVVFGVDDVAADGDVADDRDAQSPTGGTQAVVTMREISSVSMVRLLRQATSQRSRKGSDHREPKHHELLRIRVCLPVKTATSEYHQRPVSPTRTALSGPA